MKYWHALNTLMRASNSHICPRTKNDNCLQIEVLTLIDQIYLAIRFTINFLS